MLTSKQLFCVGKYFNRIMANANIEIQMAFFVLKN